MLGTQCVPIILTFDLSYFNRSLGMRLRDLVQMKTLENLLLQGLLGIEFYVL